MNNHKATPEQWKADKYDWSKADTEAATDEDLDDTWHKTTGGTFLARRRAVYNLGIEHGQAHGQEVAELKAELERERIRLAACGVVAKADTPESAKEARDMHPDYHSASLDDVISMVDALMAERAKQAGSREVAEPAPVAGGLVERVARAIHTRVATVEVELWKPEARAASFEVAEWLREQGWKEAAIMIEQEAGR